MHRRLTKLLTLWMLPLLVARAIVPVGFMFMADVDGLRMMFCPAVSQPTGAQMQAHVHAGNGAGSGAGHDARQDVQAGVQQMHAAHAGHAHGDGPSAEHDKTPCPFSLVAALARLEMRVSLEEVLTRFPRYEIDETRLERVYSGNVRGYSRMPMRLS